MKSIFPTIPARLVGLAALCCACLVAQPVFGAAHGPGLGKVTFTQAELFKAIFQFPRDVVGYHLSEAFMHNGYLIIPGNTSDAGLGAALTVWNVSNPRKPVMVSRTLYSGNKSHAISIVGDLVTIRGNHIDATTIWDFSDPAAPKKIATFDGADTNLWSHWIPPYIYTGGEGPNGSFPGAGGVTIWDATNPASPKQVKYLNMPQLVGFPCGPVNVVGNLMVISGSYDANAGHVLLDVSNPANPVILDVMKRPGSSTYTALINGYRLYNGAAGGGTLTRSLSIYDLRDPLRITLLRDVSLGNTSETRSVWIQDNFAHVANKFSNSYQRIDINSFSIVGQGVMPGNFSEIAVPFGNWAFVGQDYQNSSTPTSIGAFVVPFQADPDNRGPEVNMVNPPSNAVKRALTSRVGITLTDQIDSRTINSSTFIIRPLGGSALSGKYSNQTAMLNFSPSVPLLANTTYEVIVPAGGIKDISGNPITAPFRSVFSTGSTIGGGTTVTAPSITTQPMSQSVNAGQTAMFSVVASGTAPLAYQWQKNSVNISGATGSSYTTPATTSADNGKTFRVLISNSAGSVTSSSATLTVNTVAQTNNATFVSQSVPTSMTAGQGYSVSVAMKNSGTTTWTAATGYKLGAQNPQDNVTWGHRVELAAGDAIAPGQTKTFTFNVIAPGTAGTSNFQWRMVREGVAWFGGLSANVGVTVSTGTGTPTQAPYGGPAWAIPGTIQAENFDTGGEGVAYHDTTSANAGGAYRTGGVDIVGGHDGGTIIGWTLGGEWLEYTVNVTVSGNYLLEARVSSIDSSGKFHVEFNGVNKTGAITMPVYNGAFSWQTLTRTVSLTAGQQVMRIAFDSNGTGNVEVANLNHVRLTVQIPIGSG
jgi:hypothetical protein